MELKDFAQASRTLPSCATERSPHPAPMLDLVEELRLRRWARANHVPLADRDADWHPVILDEMSHKDSELLEEQQTTGFAGIAPLDGPRSACHTPHRSAGPRFLASPQRSGELYYT